MKVKTLIVPFALILLFVDLIVVSDLRLDLTVRTCPKGFATLRVAV